MSSNALLMFTLAVAGANFCVGFGSAIYAGLGPKTWPPKFFEKPPRPIAKKKRAEEDEHEAEDEHHETPPTAAAAAEEKKPAPPAAPETPPEQPPLVAILEQLACSFDQFEAELAAWDGNHRQQQLDADGLTTSAIELNEVASRQLDQFQQVLAPLSGYCLEDAAAMEARDAISKRGEELESHLRMVCAELGSLQFEGNDHAMASDKLTTAITQVFAVLHSARDYLEEPLVTLLGKEIHDPVVVTTLTAHSDASLLGRLCFEHAWLEIRKQKKAGSIAIIDLDGLQQVNAARGPLVARRAIGAIASMLHDALPKGTSAARVCGQQFIVTLPELNMGAAADLLEKVRQQVEHTEMQHEDAQWRMTVSAAAAAIQTADTSASVLEKLRMAVREAKNGGRNQTFTCEDDYPTAVAPRNLKVEPRVVKL
jgi:diguanylate cyclase (GGDEF)-like protein